MKKIIFLAGVILLTRATYSQQIQPASIQNVYLELGGAGILTSFNYEHKIWGMNTHSFNLRGGVGYFPLIMNTQISSGTCSVIIGVNYLKNFGNHHLSAGVNYSFANTFLYASNRTNGNYIFSNLLIPSIGYRYQKSEKNKCFIGAGYSPVISFNGYSIKDDFLQYKNHIYLLIGYTF